MEEFQQILDLIAKSEFFRILKTSLWVLFVVIWLGGVSFVTKDARRRYKKSVSQYLVILLPLFFHLPGLLGYLLIRPARTKSERAYEEEILNLSQDVFSCPECGLEIKENFVFCPSCGGEIFKRCPNCGKTIKNGWKYCPYCRKEVTG